MSDVDTAPSTNLLRDFFREQPIGLPSLDPFDDDEPLACGVENPEACDSCQ